MLLEQNKAIWHRLLEAINTGDEVAFLEVIAPDVVDHYAPPGLPPGSEGWNVNRKLFRAAFPDGRWIEEELLAEGNLVTGRYVFRGTHLGEFFGIPATGKQVTVTNMHMGRIVDGKIVEHWGNGDDLGMMQQLGVIPVAQTTEV